MPARGMVEGAPVAAAKRSGQRVTMEPEMARRRARREDRESFSRRRDQARKATMPG